MKVSGSQKKSVKRTNYHLNCRKLPPATDKPMIFLNDSQTKQRTKSGKPAFFHDTSNN